MPNGMVSGVVWDVDSRTEERVGADRGRSQKPVQTRGPGVPRGRVAGGDVKKSVGVMVDVNKTKPRPEGLPRIQEGLSGENGGGASGIRSLFNKIEVTTHKSGDIDIKVEEGVDNTRISRKLTP